MDAGPASAHASGFDVCEQGGWVPHLVGSPGPDGVWVLSDGVADEPTCRLEHAEDPDLALNVWHEPPVRDGGWGDAAAPAWRQLPQKPACTGRFGSWGVSSGRSRCCVLRTRNCGIRSPRSPTRPRRSTVSPPGCSSAARQSLQGPIGVSRCRGPRPAADTRRWSTTSCAFLGHRRQTSVRLRPREQAAPMDRDGAPTALAGELRRR